MPENTEPQLTPLQVRQAEVAQYSANIAMYESIIATLPTEWPEHLLQYRNSNDKHKTASEVSDLDDVALLSKLWYADDCHKAIRSETVEKTKAEAILAVLS
jgi:hypothetical protein